MNPNELQKLLHQNEEAMRQALQESQVIATNIDDGPVGAYLHLVVWLSQHPTAFWLLLTGYSLLWLFTTWHCLRTLQSIDRLTWLVALLGIPVFGILFYWLLNQQAREEHPDLTIYRGTVSLAPPPKSASNIADEISTSIAESVKQRRQGR